MSFDVPGFHPAYAVIVIVVLAVIVSLCKPDDGYVPLSWHDYSELLGESYARFWADRSKIWSYRLVYYYSGKYIAPTLFVFNAIVISSIAGVRYNQKLHSKLHDLRRDADSACPELSSGKLDISGSPTWQELMDSAIDWDRQLTTLLTVYFISRMIGATAMLGGSNRSILSSVVLDSWLLGVTVWSTVLDYEFIDLTETDEFQDCYDQSPRAQDFFDDYSDALFTLNSLNVCLWLMISLTLPFGLVIDLMVTTIREARYATKDPSLSALKSTFVNPQRGGADRKDQPKKQPQSSMDPQNEQDAPTVESAQKGNLDEYHTDKPQHLAGVASGSEDDSDSGGGIQRIITLVDGQQPNFEQPTVEMVGSSSLNSEAE